MADVLVTIELALIIVLPLIVFYQRLGVSFRLYLLYVVMLYLIWFATYALLHESCHLFGSWVTGARIGDYRLVPEFWKGDYRTGYVNARFDNSFQSFVSPALPYLRDVVFLFVGYAILMKRRAFHPFVSGLVLVLFVLGSVYDIVNNYVAFALGGRNDFHVIATAVGRPWTHAMGVLFALGGAWVVWRVLSLLRKVHT